MDTLERLGMILQPQVNFETHIVFTLNGVSPQARKQAQATARQLRAAGTHVDEMKLGDMRSLLTDPAEFIAQSISPALHQRVQTERNPPLPQPRQLPIRDQRFAITF